MARDVFSIPATGAGVERLFNTARDVCHYRRGRLNSTTIQDLMMFSCLTQFEMEAQQLELARAMEVPEEGEDEKISSKLDDVDLISDNEEGEEEVRVDKRRRDDSSNHESDEGDYDDNTLPSMGDKRHSGRVRKIPKHLAGYELSK